MGVLYCEEGLLGEGLIPESDSRLGFLGGVSDGLDSEGIRFRSPSEGRRFSSGFPSSFALSVFSRFKPINPFLNTFRDYF